MSNEAGPAKQKGERPDNEAARGGRARWARRLQMGAGALALVVYFFVPFLNAGTFYRVVVQPAFRISPTLSKAELQALEPELKRLVEAAHLPELQEAVGEPYPLSARADDEPHVNLTPHETLLLARTVVSMSAQSHVEGETRVIADVLTIGALSTLFLAVICLVFPVVAGASADATLVVSGVAALVLLASHLLGVGFDLSGVTDEAAFTWQSHVASAVLVIVAGTGSALPLTPRNALRVILLTLAGTMVSFGSLGAYLVFG